MHINFKFKCDSTIITQQFQMNWEWWNFFLPPIPIAASLLPVHLFKIASKRHNVPGSGAPLQNPTYHFYR